MTRNHRWLAKMILAAASFYPATAMAQLFGPREMDWRLALGAMQRPAVDLGLIDLTGICADARAMASLRFHP